MPSPELLASIREQYGLNQSLFNQFVAYFGKVLHGDLGYSYFFNLPVMELIQDRLPATLLLVVTAVCAASSSASPRRAGRAASEQLDQPSGDHRGPDRLFRPRVLDPA